MAHQPFLSARSAVLTIGVATAYFAAAQISLALLDPVGGVAVFWPAGGVASGLLIIAGSRARWPVVIGVAVATIAANLLADRNIWSSMVFVLTNTIEPLIIASLIHRFGDSPFHLNRLRNVLIFFVAAAIGAGLSGIVGTLGFVLFHWPAPPSEVWVRWFSSAALGTVAVAPLVLGIAALATNSPTRREIVEGAVALTLLVILGALLVFMPNEAWTIVLAIFALCPLLLWIASRLPPAFTALATFICAITIVWTTIFAIGIYGDPRLSLSQRILEAQATILAISLGFLVLAALFGERRTHEGALTEREARLQQALRVGRVLSFDWDVTRDELRHSDNAGDILGLHPGQILTAAEWRDNIHPDDRPIVAASLQGASPTRPSHSSAFRYRRPDGDEVWLEQIAIVQFDSAGKLVRVHGLRMDITERKEFEDKLSLARKSAELADQAKSGFLSAASHDLRQPLQTLKLLQASLARHCRDDETRVLVSDMGRSLNTMSAMLSSLLDVNMLEAGRLQPSFSEFPLDELFDALAADFARVAQEKGLALRIVRSKLIVRSDRRMLEQMIRNLLSNAVRYTHRGRILLGSRRAGDRIRIEVWDRGVGITEAQLPHIFNEYYQGKASTEQGGVGLGLAIVKRLGTILDHRIDVQSTVGKGTRFFIEVPRGVAANEPEPAETAPRQDEVFAGHVLVIEDEASVRSALTRLFNANRIDATLVGSANEAMTLIRGHGLRPDLLLCDYNLRGSPDGIETIKLLRTAMGRDVPAVLMTGDIRAKESALAEGDPVLIKPFVAEELIDVLKAQVSRLPSSRCTGDLPGAFR